MVRQATPVMNPLTDCCGMEYPQSMARTTGKRLLVREVMKRMRFHTLVTYLLLKEKKERQTCIRTMLREDWGCNHWGVVSLSK